MAKVKKETLSLEEKLEQVLIPIDEQPYKLPENWCWTKLSAISEVVTGSTPSKSKPEYYGDNFPFFKPADLDAGRNTVVASEYLSDEGKGVSRIIPAQSTAVCCIGSIGKSGYLEVEGTTNQQINSVIPKINPLYLYYFINTDVFVNELWEKASATTISIVNKSKMESNVVPLAPLAEQQRIVEQIESLFAKLDEAKEKAQDIVDKFGDVERAILYDAFTGKLTKKWRIKNSRSEDSWIDLTLQEVCCMKITDGTHKTPTYCEKEDGGIPFISAKDVTTKKICWDNIKYIIPELHEELYARLAPQMDDILLAKNGTTGVAAIVDVDKVFDLYVTLAVLRPNKNVINPRYLLNIVNSPICKNQFDEHLTGIGVPNLHLRDIKNVKISLPKLDEQEEVIRIVDNLLEKETRAFELAKHTVESIDIMKKTVLAKAFRGELGTNNPDEENAIELLKAILA
ncbi:MAG: restriction endonuclease [Lachnospiraceae bacterium]|nr:restriction endonuclease [Lachnospiraceae bacterium]